MVYGGARGFGKSEPEVFAMRQAYKAGYAARDGMIVLCKDCRHRRTIKGIPSCELHFLKTLDDWFCADGERQGADDES